MKNEINIINFQNKLPLSISIIHFDTVVRHMHSNAQLLLVLEGECDIYLNDKQYHAISDDMIIINPKQFHHIISNDTCTVISVLIDIAGFSLEDNLDESIYFNLNTMELKYNPRYDQIRYLVYSIIAYNTMENINSIYTNRAISYSFFAQLINDFKGTYNDKDIINKDSLDTINTISAYLNDHYKESITLQFLSDKFSYSVSYLSRLFKDTYGKNFIDIYDNLRVNYSLNDLLIKNKNKTINQIAFDNGFEDVRSYVRAFKKIHNMTPNEYRNLMQSKTSPAIQADNKLLRKQTLDLILSKYERSIDVKEEKHSIRNTEYTFLIDYKAKTKKINFFKNKILEFNHPSDLLNEDMKEIIENSIKELKIDYILLLNFLNTHPNVIFKNETGQWDIDYFYLSQIINKILTYNTLPYLVFEYDPSILNYEEFFSLISQMVEFLTRIFKDKIDNSYFAFSIVEDKIEQAESDDFIKLLMTLKENVNKRNPNILIGGPLFSKNTILNKKLYNNFINKVRTFNLDLDFYPIAYTSCKDPDILTKDKHELRTFIDYLKDNNLFFEGKTFLHSINFTSCNSLLNDTIYASSYAAQNFIENIENLNTYSKNCFIDKRIINAFDANLFQGKPGLFTYNYIKKSTYNSFVLISKLEHNLIKKDKHYIALKGGNKITILLNNYTHYSDLFASREYFQITNLNRYACFPKSTSINFKINITNLPSKSFEYKIYKITKNSGSSYDKWLEEGAKNFLNPEEISNLKNLSSIDYSYEEDYVNQGSAYLEVNLLPHEVKLIEIILKN